MIQPIKMHGGKHYLADRIVGLMPPRKSAESPGGYLHYVETHAGGLSVLLANDPLGISEVANDTHQVLMNFWGCIGSAEGIGGLQILSTATPFSQSLWEDCQRIVRKVSLCPADTIRKMEREAKIQLAYAFLVLCRQSLAGRMKSFAPLSRRRVRRGMNEQASAWLSAVEGLPEVHERMKRVVLLQDDALKVILAEDAEETLFYCDPPYLHETRAAEKVYDHEMNEGDHRALLDGLRHARGRFILSGYRSGLYDDFASRFGWRRVDFDLPNHAAGGRDKRRMTESCWLNYDERGVRLGK